MELKLSNLIFIPLILFGVSVAVLVLNYFETGDFILKDIDLKGGTLITISTPGPVDVRLLEEKIVDRFGGGFVNGIATESGFGATIQLETGTKSSDVVSVVEEAGIEVLEFEEVTVGPALGNLFFEQVRIILIAAFVLMSFVIFLIYRNVFSSFGIVFSALGNILTTLALTSLLGIPLSFAGFAGLLMLIGFTVDTNIVLTSKIVAPGVESFKVRYRRALLTGGTIIATIAATMFLVMFLSTSRLLVNIAEVLVIGFLTDLVYTWIFNAGLLETYFKRKYGHLEGMK